MTMNRGGGGGGGGSNKMTMNRCIDCMASFSKMFYYSHNHSHC